MKMWCDDDDPKGAGVLTTRQRYSRKGHRHKFSSAPRYLPPDFIIPDSMENNYIDSPDWYSTLSVSDDECWHLVYGYYDNDYTLF